MTPLQILIAIGAFLISIGSGWAKVKEHDKRITKVEANYEVFGKSVQNIEKILVALQVGEKRYLLPEHCAHMNRRIDDAFSQKLAETKNEIYQELKDVESRMSKQIDEIKALIEKLREEKR